MFQAKLSRRGFLVGCSAAIAGMAGARLGRVAMASNPQAGNTNDVLIVIFLRGGWDVLSVLPPVDGPDRGVYERARPRLKIPARGANAALNLNDQLGLHPRLAPLMDLYRGGHMAIVQAAGLAHDTRSHFDAMEYIELGTPGNKTTTSGWITRHLNAKPNSGSVIVPAVGVGYQPSSLLAMDRAISVGNLGEMNLPGGEDSRRLQVDLLRRMHDGPSWMQHAGANALNAIDALQRAVPGEYTPSGGATYPDSEFGYSLKSIAQMLRSDLGLQAASIDYGGWDTHEWQADGVNGYLADQLGGLAAGLSAFYQDIDAAGLSRRVTIVTMSEFGRRLAENESAGTDHGHGSAMFVLGGNVNGGQLYGSWPGLETEQLFERSDLAVTTDFRRVLSEITSVRLGNPNIAQVFPGYGGYAPMGIVRA